MLMSKKGVKKQIYNTAGNVCVCKCVCVCVRMGKILTTYIPLERKRINKQFSLKEMIEK